MGNEFFDTSQFEFVSRLEEKWQKIRSELMSLKEEHFMPWPEKEIYDQGWDVFGLHAFGQKLEGNCKLCPETTRLVETIPGMTTAGFSSLAAGTHITPHCGYTSDVLRFHLGLLVPEPEKCTLRVNSEIRHWEEGKALIFDDTLEHEAWNTGERTRIILLVDFVRP